MYKKAILAIAVVFSVPIVYWFISIRLSQQKINALTDKVNKANENVLSRCSINTFLTSNGSGKDLHKSQQACDDFKENSLAYLSDFSLAVENSDMVKMLENSDRLFEMESEVMEKVIKNMKYENGYHETRRKYQNKRKYRKYYYQRKY